MQMWNLKYDVAHSTHVAGNRLSPPLPQDLSQLQALSVSEGTPTPTTALAAPSEKHNALNAADQPGHLQRHPRHNEDIGESSSPGDPYAAGPSALERELLACQDEVRSMNVQIHRMRYRISMRKVAEEWYPTERRSNEDQLWLCKKRTAQLAKQHKRLLAETKASQSQYLAR
nr:PREDICTED: uncharacterized protein LOC108952115 [Musa acuminata subsp. malaccensis]